MSETPNASDRRLQQLENMAEAKAQIGEAIAIEAAVPEMVAEIAALRAERERMSAKIAAAIEDLHSITKQAGGEAEGVMHTAAAARQRLRGELGPGAVGEEAGSSETASSTDPLIAEIQQMAKTARRKTHAVREGRYVYDHDGDRFVHVRSDGAERTMFRACEFSFDEQNVALWAFNDAPRMAEVAHELAGRYRHTEEHLRRAEPERRVAIELINAEGLTGEYVHRLDAEGLVDHKAHDDVPAGTGAETSLSSEAVLHLYSLADEHGDAMISGNSEGLRILKHRLERALQSTAEGGYYMDHGYSENKDEQIFAADGEGYHITVECRPASVHDPSWQQRPEPYYVSRRFARESRIL